MVENPVIVDWLDNTGWHVFPCPFHGYEGGVVAWVCKEEASASNTDHLPLPVEFLFRQKACSVSEAKFGCDVDISCPAVPKAILRKATCHGHSISIHT